MQLIQNNFLDLFNIDYFAQSQAIPFHYVNTKYDLWFFHDFDKWHSLEEQLPIVEEKYKRRIDRFYKAICEETLFIRYICSEDSDSTTCDELKLIESTYNDILTLIRKFNPNNDIIFIANSNIKSDIIKIYPVERDESDKVARKPFEKNLQLKNYFTKVEFDGKDENIIRYQEKERRKRYFIKKIENNTARIFRKIFKKGYRFIRQVD